MNLQLITAPNSKPVNQTDIEGQTRITDLSEEALTIDTFINAVVEQAEAVTRRALITQEWELILDKFPSAREPILLPKPPLQHITSIKYIDVDGVEQTFYDKDNLDFTCRFVNDNQVPYIMPTYGLNWPVALNDLAVVKIRFVCGYGPIDPNTSNNVPNGIKQWICINVANLYENRETIGVAYRETKFELPTIADGLIANYRVIRL